MKVSEEIWRLGLSGLERCIRFAGPINGRRFAKLCGWAAAQIVPREYRILEAQIEYVRPLIPALQGVPLKEIHREVLQHTAESVAEVFCREQLLRINGNRGQLYPGVTNFEAVGEDVARACAMEAHEGTSNMAIAGHIGNFELMAAYHKLSGLPCTIIGREPQQQAIAEWLLALRNEHGGEALLRSGNASKREVAQALLSAYKTGRTLSVLLDQDTGLENEFAPFFGLEAAHPVTPIRLAVRYRVKMFTTFSVRTAPFQHRVTSKQIIYNPDSPNACREILTEYCKRLEAAIREFPLQYLWFHRRWRRRPGIDYSQPGAPLLDTDQYIKWIRRQEPH